MLSENGIAPGSRPARPTDTVVGDGSTERARPSVPGRAQQPSSPGQPAFANRIVGYRPSVDPRELQPNPDNPRVHPQQQRDAIRGVLSEIGWVGTAIYNVRTGRLVDGHERQQEAIVTGTTMPVLDVDLSPDEERLVMATFDPLAALASYDEQTLGTLLEDVSTSSEAVATLLADMQQQIDVLADAAAGSTFTNQGQSHLGGDRAIERATIVRIAVHVQSVRRIEQALARAIALAARSDNPARLARGDALSEIVEQYLLHTPATDGEP